MSEFSIYELIRLESLNRAIYGSDEFFYRKVCRWFSKTFNTPLNIVEKTPWHEILTHYYESQYESMSRNDLIKVAKEVLPEIAQEEEKQTEDFIKELLAQEQAKKQSLKKENQPHKELKDPPIKNLSVPDKQELFKVFDDEYEP